MCIDVTAAFLAFQVGVLECKLTVCIPLQCEMTRLKKDCAALLLFLIKRALLFKTSLTLSVLQEHISNMHDIY